MTMRIIGLDWRKNELWTEPDGLIAGLYSVAQFEVYTNLYFKHTDFNRLCSIKVIKFDGMQTKDRIFVYAYCKDVINCRAWSMYSYRLNFKYGWCYDVLSANSKFGNWSGVPKIEVTN